MSRHRVADRAAALGPYLIAPAGLAAVVVAIAVVRTGPAWIAPAALGLLLGGGLLWIVASALAPAQADKTCPRCGADELQRLDQGTTRGVRCAGCHFVDASVSSFYLAEEEGALEPMILAERRSARRSR